MPASSPNALLDFLRQTLIEDFCLLTRVCVLPLYLGLLFGHCTEIPGEWKEAAALVLRCFWVLGSILALCTVRVKLAVNTNEAAGLTVFPSQGQSLEHCAMETKLLRPAPAPDHKLTPSTGKGEATPNSSTAIVVL